MESPAKFRKPKTPKTPKTAQPQSQPPVAIVPTIVENPNDIIEAEGKEQEIKKYKNIAVFTFGRFNPPHIGHLRLFKTVHDVAKALKADYYIVPSPKDYTSEKSIDKMRKYPLTIAEKMDFLYDLYPTLREDDALINLSRNTPADGVRFGGWSAFSVVNKLIALGYEKIIFIVGQEDEAVPLKLGDVSNIVRETKDGRKQDVELQVYHLENAKAASEGQQLSEMNMSATDIRNIFTKGVPIEQPTPLEKFKSMYRECKYIGSFNDENLEKHFDTLGTVLTKTIPARATSGRRPRAEGDYSEPSVIRRARTAIGGKAKPGRTKAATAYPILS